jgi:O-antigen/teichoic acid export membrane protein
MKGRIQSSIAFLNNLLNKGHDRSTKAKKNIVASVLIRGLSISISLVLVPLTINYLNSSRYGIWLTISSIVGWFSFFNVGLTQGLRNRFAEAKARGDDKLAQSYVSTTYAVLAIIFTCVWLIFLAVNHFLNWSHILNISESMRSEVSALAIIVFTYFCMQFVLSTVTTVLLANQESAKSSLIDVLGQIVSLVFILVLVRTTEGSLVKLGFALCLSPLIALVGANLFFFTGEYRKYRPAFSTIKFSNAKQLFNIGIIFFIIQVAGLIQYETANIIIARNFTTADVTSYNIVFKYFNILNMAFVIFLTPFWSASTEAYVKNDIPWIKNAIKKYNLLNLVLVLAGLIMLIFSQQVYTLWLGEGKVNISFYLSLYGFLYFSLTMFANKYVYFLNGINALRIQFLACTVSPILYIIAALLLIHVYKLGVYSLFVASIIANFNGYILSPLQYHFIINKKKKGIWTK